MYMSLIPKHFIDSVVAIGVQQSCNEYLEKVWIGTGFLVDAQAFPGNSGGPIISRPENISLVGTANNFRANLIGILSAYIPYKDVLISQQTQEIRMVQTENSGLTIVHPVDRIKEVVLLEWDRNRVYFPNNFITCNNETDKKEVDKVLEEKNDIIETNNIVNNENKL